MSLHRSDTKPDWDKLDASSYNRFQGLAARTRGFVTPANIISVVGFGLVIWGLLAILAGQVWFGLALLIVGRLLDVIDGTVAEATQTKSPIGEFVDAALDKAATFLVAIVLVVQNTADWWLIAGLLLPQIGAVIVAFYQKRRGVDIHPTRSGKLSMVFVWVGAIGLLAIKSLEGSVLLIGLVYGAIGVSFLLGMRALWQYTTGISAK